MVHHRTAVDIGGGEIEIVHWAVIQMVGVTALVVGPHIGLGKVGVVYHTHRADFASCQPQAPHTDFQAAHQAHQLSPLLNYLVPCAY